MLRACVLTCLAACAGCSSPQLRTDPSQRGYRQRTITYQLPPLRNGVELYAQLGHIRVTASDESILEKTLTISAESKEQARTIADGCRVTIEQRAEGKTKIVFVPAADFPIERVGADSTLRIPDKLSLKLRTRSGLIDTTAYTARALEVEAHDGTLLIGKTSERLEFSNRSGRTEVEHGFHDATGSSTTGDVLIRRPRPGAKLDFRTVSGTCTVLLPADLGAKIRFRTIHGRISGDLGDRRNDQRTNSESRWREQRMTLPGEGKPFELFVESDEGDLIVRRTTRSED